MLGSTMTGFCTDRGRNRCGEKERRSAKKNKAKIKQLWQTVGCILLFRSEQCWLIQAGDNQCVHFADVSGKGGE